MTRSSQTTRPRPILLTGGSGQVGSELVRALASLGPVVAPRSSELDLADPESIRRVVRAVAPSIVINAGAYTAVDRAESEPQRCYAINADGAGVLAVEAKRIDAPVVHYSTDYVFDGAKATAFTELDLARPLNVYGAAKLAGELAVAGAQPAHLIFRTSWVYGAQGNNFLRTVRRLSRDRRELRIVDDQVGTPTWSGRIADVTRIVLTWILQTDSDLAASFASLAGTYHLTAGGATSWCGFARAIVERDPRPDEIICERIVPCTTEEYGAAAARPRSSLLDTGKIRSTFSVSLPDWSADLDRVLTQLRNPL